jgi:tRNA U34 2-thiouridine synthase MnmA/TrmU
VHMKLHDASPGGTAGHCCGLDDALDARRVADTLGIPFYVMNLREAFEKAVMNDFADDYLAGRTPNPCVQCNGVLKFRILLGRAGARRQPPRHRPLLPGWLRVRCAWRSTRTRTSPTSCSRSPPRP